MAELSQAQKELLCRMAAAFNAAAKEAAAAKAAQAAQAAAAAQAAQAAEVFHVEHKIVLTQVGRLCDADAVAASLNRIKIAIVKMAIENKIQRMSAGLIKNWLKRASIQADLQVVCLNCGETRSSVAALLAVTDLSEYFAEEKSRREVAQMAAEDAAVERQIAQRRSFQAAVEMAARREAANQADAWMILDDAPVAPSNKAAKKAAKSNAKMAKLEGGLAALANLK